MNFIRLLFLSLILLLFNYSFAQRTDKADVYWGEKFKDAKRTTLGDVIAHDQTGIYTLKFASRGKYNLYIEHFNNEMNRTLSKGIEFKQPGTKMSGRYEYSLQLDDRLYLFFSVRDKSTIKYTLYVQELDKSTLEFKRVAKKITSLSAESRRRQYYLGYNFDLSEDSSHVLIYYSLPNEKKSNEKIGFYVLDNNLDSVWSKDVILPYSDKLFELNNYQISNQGDVYVLGKLNRDKKDKEKAYYSHKILAYFKNDQEKIFSVEVEQKFLQEMRIVVNSKNEIICAGFYSESYKSVLKGSFFLKVDGESKEITTKSFKEFSWDFITQNFKSKTKLKAKKREAKGKDVGLGKYEMRSIILREDGGAVLIAEQYYVTESTTTDANGNTRTTFYYHYNDIVVINIDPNGQIEWAEKIAKRQNSANDGGYYSSYALAVTNEKLYFIFNDNGKNLMYNGTGKVEPYKRGKDAVVTLIDMDMDGRQNREILFIATDAQVYTRPKVFEQISDDTMIIFGQRKKLSRYGKIIFKN